MKRTISLRGSEHCCGLPMAVFEFCVNKVRVMSLDLPFQRFSKGQNLVNSRPIGTMVVPLSLQLLKAMLNALHGVIRLSAYQTQSLAVPRRDGTVHIEYLPKPGALVASDDASREMPEL